MHCYHYIHMHTHAYTHTTHLQLKCNHYKSGCPSRMRSDHGTEKTIIALCQMVLRHNHTDHHAGCNSFVFGNSVRNMMGNVSK